MANKKKERVLEFVVCDVEATDDGFYKGRIIKTGEKFRIETMAKDGKLPLWVKPLGPIKKKAAPKVEAVKEEGEGEEDSVSSLV
jgi:hypothetical protein